MNGALRNLISSIITTLKDQTHPDLSHPLTSDRIAKLLFRIEELSHPHQHILTAILGSEDQTKTLVRVLTCLLRREEGETNFEETYRKHINGSDQGYRCSLGDIDRTIKDILVNAKPIEEELAKLHQNFHAHLHLPNDDLDLTFDHPAQDYQLGILLKMKMQSPILDLQKQFDEMLFRMFIVWESLTVILHKCQYVLDQLNGMEKREERCEKKKGKMNIAKRSTLSESVEIYKLKKQEEKEKEKQKEKKAKASLSEPYTCRNLISSDYKLICKPRQQEQRADHVFDCCFR